MMKLDYLFTRILPMLWPRRRWQEAAHTLKRNTEMPWESRRGRGRYYTQTIKDSGSICRNYIGQGPMAELTAAQDQVNRAKRLAEIETRKKERLRLNDAARVSLRFEVLLDLLIRGTLLSHGFHQHDRGAWRLSRDGNQNKGQ